MVDQAPGMLYITRFGIFLDCVMGPDVLRCAQDITFALQLRVWLEL